jgi:hypothetical protein
MSNLAYTIVQHFLIGQNEQAIRFELFENKRNTIDEIYEK